MQKPDFSFEDRFKGPVCGVDEVGRGPLAGPVVAAAVVLRRDIIPHDLLGQINDSKALTAAKREYLSAKIREYAHVSLAACDVGEIDRINILQASMKAMQLAVEGLGITPAAALVDGNRAPPLACATLTVVKGDARSLSIAAASIVAKQHRDELMQTYAVEFPHYGWEKNAGYGTKHHMKAIEIHGITPLHRKSFSPIAHYILKLNSANN